MSCTPDFDGELEGYVHNQLKRHFWRVSKTLAYDDVMQEARLVFVECRARYCPIDTPQHFMSLFKTAWYRRFTDLAYTSSRKTDHEVPDFRIYDEGEGVDTFISTAQGETGNAGPVLVALHRAPAEVKAVLSLMLNAPQEMVEAVEAAWKAKGKKRGMGNAHLCRLLGRPEGEDLLGHVRDYFGDGRV